MQAIIFDSENKKIESLLFANPENVSNYFNLTEDSKFIVFVQNHRHLDGVVKLDGNCVLIGEYVKQNVLRVFEGIFDFAYYNITDEVLSKEEQDKVNENLIHMYLGGDENSVPYPMPYRKEILSEEDVFQEMSRIENLTVYTK